MAFLSNPPHFVGQDENRDPASDPDTTFLSLKILGIFGIFDKKKGFNTPKSRAWYGFHRRCPTFRDGYPKITF
jgi:hypothetical protein